MAGGKGDTLSLSTCWARKSWTASAACMPKVTIEPNCTLGFHEHHGETESYYIPER